MNYKPSDTMNLVHEVKKLGWHFTHSKENISINRHNVTLSLYREVDPEAWREENRKKQAAGVKFQNRCGYFWQEGNWNFEGNKEDYREASQPAVEPVDKIPHAAERALWKAQRAAGTNEVWQEKDLNNEDEWGDLPMGVDPAWSPESMYRVKPKTVTCCTVNIELDLIRFKDKQALENCLNNFFTIIGYIETREVEV